MKSLVAPILLLGAIIVIAMVGLASKDQPISATKAAKILEPYLANIEAPGATVKDAGGQDIELGTVIDHGLITFWSSACGECDTQLTDLGDFTAANPNFNSVLVGVKEDPNSAKAKTLPASYFDDGTAFQKWSGTMPSSYYIESGQIKYFFPGRISKEHLEALKK